MDTYGNDNRLHGLFVVKLGQQSALSGLTDTQDFAGLQDEPHTNGPGSTPADDNHGLEDLNSQLLATLLLTRLLQTDFQGLMLDPNLRPRTNHRE